MATYTGVSVVLSYAFLLTILNYLSQEKVKRRKLGEENVEVVLPYCRRDGVGNVF
jgi:hypothetical protein